MPSRDRSPWHLPRLLGVVICPVLPMPAFKQDGTRAQRVTLRPIEQQEEPLAATSAT
jgi:hypothetical protein